MNSQVVTLPPSSFNIVYTKFMSDVIYYNHIAILMPPKKQVAANPKKRKAD